VASVILGTPTVGRWTARESNLRGVTTRKLRPTANVWVQKDGAPIRITDMGDEHLQHTVRMLGAGRTA
jgi:hypothetical protein